MRRSGLLMLATCGRVGFDPLEADAPASLGPWGAPAAVDELNSTTFDDDPSLTGDMLEIYFNSPRSGAVGGSDIWVATRGSTSAPFGTPTNPTTLNTGVEDATPEVSRDGLTMYLCSDRMGTLGGTDIYMSTRATRTAPWAVPVHVPELSSTGDDESPAVDDSGLTVYITSDTLSPGIQKLLVSTRASTAAAWTTPRLVAELDAGTERESAFSSSDQRTLWFSSEGIYVATRTSPSAAFGPAQLESGVNSANTDSDPWVSPDGRVMYFARVVSGQGFNIFRATR